MTTGKESTHWNVNSLHDYLKDKIFFVGEKSDLRIDATLDEMHKIELLNDEKHKQMNEVREQLRDQAKTFITEKEYNLKHENLDNKINVVNRIVWIGLGVWAVLQIILGAVLVILFKK